MDYNKYIGQRVIKKSGEIGVIVEVSKYIKVDFTSKTALFKLDAFTEGFLMFEDEKLQKLVEKEAAIEQLEKQKNMQDRFNKILEEEEKKKQELIKHKTKKKVTKKVAK